MIATILQQGKTTGEVTDVTGSANLDATTEAGVYLYHCGYQGTEYTELLLVAMSVNGEVLQMLTSAEEGLFLLRKGFVTNGVAAWGPMSDIPTTTQVTAAIATAITGAIEGSY